MAGERIVCILTCLLLLSGCLTPIDVTEKEDGTDNAEAGRSIPGCDSRLFSVNKTDDGTDAVNVCLTKGVTLDSLLQPYRSMAVGNGQPDLFDATNSPEAYGVNITTWQLDNGGWGKIGFERYMQPWNGTEPKSVYPCTDERCQSAELSTFDNNGTTAEMRFLALLYTSSDAEDNRTLFKNAFRNGLDFILNAQHRSGGWPQVYPEQFGRGEFSNLGTYNDHVIVRNLVLLRDLIAEPPRFDPELTEGLNQTAIHRSLQAGMSFILKTQVAVDGSPTVWAQQYNMTTLAPAGARSYELTGRSSWESAGVVSLLLNWDERNESINEATLGGIEWYQRNAVANATYVYGLPNQEGNGEVIEQSGSVMWYRLYNLTDDHPFFSSRDGIKVYQLSEVEIERRQGYQWAGDWGTRIHSEIQLIHT